MPDPDEMIIKRFIETEDNFKMTLWMLFETVLENEERLSALEKQQKKDQMWIKNNSGYIDTLKEKIADLEKVREVDSERIEALESQHWASNNDVEDVYDDIKPMKDKIAALEEKLKKLKRERLHDFEEKVMSNETVIVNLESALLKLISFLIGKLEGVHTTDLRQIGKELTGASEIKEENDMDDFGNFCFSLDCNIGFHGSIMADCGSYEIIEADNIEEAKKQLEEFYNFVLSHYKQEKKKLDFEAWLNDSYKKEASEVPFSYQYSPEVIEKQTPQQLHDDLKAMDLESAAKPKSITASINDYCKEWGLIRKAEVRERLEEIVSNDTLIFGIKMKRIIEYIHELSDKTEEKD